MAGRIITFQMMLKDKAGVLSEILAIFANCGANILTINQSIPTGGRAMVTISAETSNASRDKPCMHFNITYPPRSYSAKAASASCRSC